MSPEERNKMWESAAAQLGLSVAAEASKLRRRRNRIEGEIDGIPVSVSYGGAGVNVTLTVRDIPYSNFEDKPVMDFYTIGDPNDPSDIVNPARETLTALRSVSSPPPLTRPVDTDAVIGVKFESRNAPRAVEILGALGAMAMFGEDPFMTLSDSSSDDFMQSARGESNFQLLCYEVATSQTYTTFVETLEEALNLNLLWLANDPAWKTAANWEPVEY